MYYTYIYICTYNIYIYIYMHIHIYIYLHIYQQSRLGMGGSTTKQIMCRQQATLENLSRYADCQGSRFLCIGEGCEESGCSQEEWEVSVA